MDLSESSFSYKDAILREWDYQAKHPSRNTYRTDVHGRALEHLKLMVPCKTQDDAQCVPMCSYLSVFDHLNISKCCTLS